MKQITKLFLPLFISFDLLSASEQIILILSKDFNTSSAQLTPYERDGRSFVSTGETFDVVIGRNGLAWGIGEAGFTPKKVEPIKEEGDGRAPAGIFKLSSAFGYAPSTASKMPYIQANKTLICVDDTHSHYYNQILDKDKSDDPKSFEWMRRDDKLYKLGLVVQHNVQGVKGAGSCIFFHIQRASNSPTAGCSAMSEKNLAKILMWLDPLKNPRVVQIPQSYCLEATKLFPGFSCP